MSCHTSNCGCGPSGYPTANNECCTDVAEYTRFAYSSAQSAYANAQNAEQSAEDAAAALANAVLKTGSTMTGLLILSGDPIVALGAATKQYADTKVAKAGDTMTGLLTLSGAPVNNLHATTKIYVDTADALKLNLSGGTLSGALTVNAGITSTSIVSGASISSTGTILSSGATSGIGYSNGSGSSVVQSSSRTSGVTINNICGSIQLVSAAGTSAWTSFTVTNSAVDENDVVILNQKSGTDRYDLLVTDVANGSFEITFATTGGTTTEQPVLNFAIIKASNT